MTPSLAHAVCSTEGCAIVTVFRIEIDHHEANRLARRFLAAAGWLVLGQDKFCPACSEMLRRAQRSLSREMRVELEVAIDQYHRLRLMEVTWR